MSKPSVHALIRLSLRHPRYFLHLIQKRTNYFLRRIWLENNPDKDDSVPPPLVYKFVLTTECNLRCKYCMLWGEKGSCKGDVEEAKESHIDWDTLKGALSEIGDRRPNIIFTGGEPLLYPKFSELMEMIREKKCFSIINTNGTLLDRYVEIFDGNPYATLLISLDGLKKENDSLRGQGVYDKVIDNIRRIKSLKNPPYIGVQFTVAPENVGVMYDFCEAMVGLDIDWVLFNLCWFITEKQAKDYEALMEKFHVTPRTHRGFLIDYPLDPQAFISEYARIDGKRWPIQISCYLNDPEGSITGYVDSTDRTDGFCFQQWVRMTVLPNGRVTPCALYPDLTFGGIGQTSMDAIWNSKNYAEFRKLIRKGPMPLCTKCDCLYLYDLRRGYI